ncbi:hypothetical protein TNCV_5086901 [Trichonephila clavipes]|nr:hypothetical protein TNCV_5086901 [Trichonephila clavipes]
MRYICHVVFRTELCVLLLHHESDEGASGATENNGRAMQSVGFWALKLNSTKGSSMPKLWMWRYMVAPSIVMFYRPCGNFTELNRTVTCMVLKAKANDSRTSSPLPQ